jgi:protein-S-isoprenylcysteine O-methyltransferase Ste14
VSSNSRASAEIRDKSNAVVRPPIAWALAFASGLAINLLYPLRWIPATWPNVLMGGILFATGFALAIWAIVTFRRAGTRVETTKPTLAIVTHGPYGFTRNPIYLGMFLGQTGYRLRQPVDSGDADPVLSRPSLRRSGAGRSVSRSQIWRRLLGLQIPRAPVALEQTPS